MATTNNTLLLALFDGLGESVTPTASFTPASGYPLSNLTNSQLFSRTRNYDLASGSILTWDHGSAVDTNVFALFGTNASLSALRRYRAADDAGFTVNVVESGSTLTAAFDTSVSTRTIYVPPWGRSLIYIHPTSHSRRYRRWHQTDTTNPDGYNEWGIARYGLALQFEFDNWRKLPDRIGSTGSEKNLRGHEINFHNLSRNEAYNLESLAMTSLSSRRMLVIPEALTPATYLFDALWAVIENVFVRESVIGTSYTDKRYRVTMTFREVDR